MVNRKLFFNHLRQGLFRGRLSKSQVQGCEVLLEAWADTCSHLDRRWLAYCLATAYHETAATMQPIAEYGRGRGKRYGRPAGPHRQRYYGRGFVQLTWRENYRRAGEILNVDLERYPDQAMVPDNAARILFEGMIEGWFTGRKLADYIDGNRADFRNARRIVNGMDRAALIAGYAREFDAALAAAKAHEGAGAASDPVTTGKPLSRSTTFWSAVGGTLVNALTAVFSLGETQPLLAGAVILAGLAFAVWIIRERHLKARIEGI